MSPAITALGRTHGGYARRGGLGYQIAVFILALVYGATLSQLPSDTFKDWANYLVYAESSLVRLGGLWDVSPLVTLANEPLWLLINSALALVLPPETAVRMIIFVPATLVAWMVLRYDPRQFVWLVMVLFLPQVIKNHLIHLRQGTAIAVFLLGWFSKISPVRWLLMGVAPFIHSSFALVLPLLWLATGMQRLRFGADLRTLVFTIGGILIGTSLAWLAALVGARQAAEYSFAMDAVSGLGFLFWFTVFALMCFEGRRFLREYAFQAGAVIFYLSTYFLIEVAARVFESALILVLLASLEMTCWRRIVFLAILVCYGAMQWLMRLNVPLMGFGVE